MRLPDYLTGTADVMASTAEGGEIRVNLGDFATGAGYDSDVPIYGLDGFLSRPNDPGDDGAATAVYFHDGHQRRVVGVRDNRYASQAGTLAPGDRAIVTNGPARVFLKQERAAVSLYTEMAQPPPVGGKSMLFDMGGDSGVIILRSGGAQIIVDGQAGTITMIAAGPAGAATMVVDGAKGVSIKAGVINLDAPFVTGGLNFDGTRPGVPGVDTAVAGPMGQSAIASPHFFIAIK